MIGGKRSRRNQVDGYEDRDDDVIEVDERPLSQSPLYEPTPLSDKIARTMALSTMEQQDTDDREREQRQLQILQSYPQDHPRIVAVKKQ